MAADKKWKDTLPSTREWQERTRAKIAASNVIEDALKAASGEIEISNTRASMIRTLLDRVLPAQTQTDATVTTTDKPADLQALKQAIAQSPELQAMLKSLLVNGGNRQAEPATASMPANPPADPMTYNVEKNTGLSTSPVIGWTKVETTDRDGKVMEMSVPPSPSLPSRHSAP